MPYQIRQSSVSFLTSDDLEKRRCHYYFDIHNASVLVLSGPLITTLDNALMPEWGNLGRCVGVNFLTGSHHEHTVASFVEEIQATASTDFGGRFRSAVRRLGRLGELDDMLVALFIDF